MSHPMKDQARQFLFQAQALKQLTGQLEGDQWLHRVNGTSHPYWLLGHLAYCRRLMLRMMGVEIEPLAWEEQFARDTRPGDCADSPVPKVLIVDILMTGEKIARRLEEITPEELAQSCGRDLPSGASNVGGMIEFLAFHEAYHTGQFALINRSLGCDPLVPPQNKK